jgi:DNA invertase Pin-like site-specific DNA recombinase
VRGEDAGASATNDRRPEFQRVIEAGTSKPAPFDVVIVHSFSRFFRDHFELEFYVRKVAKNGVKLVSITQEMGDDPMHVMMRQIMSLFDEYKSKENAKPTGAGERPARLLERRAIASSPPRRAGPRVKKKLEVAPLHADTVRLIVHLALDGDGGPAPMGVKVIVNHLNARRNLHPRRRALGYRPCSPHPDPAHLYWRARVQQAHQGEGAEAAERGRGGRGAAAHRPRHFRTVQARLKAAIPRSCPPAW